MALPINIEDFDEYIRQCGPLQREAAYAWSTAIGLQAVDGLKVSDYLLELARKGILGENMRPIQRLMFIQIPKAVKGEGQYKGQVKQTD